MSLAARMKPKLWRGDKGVANRWVLPSAGSGWLDKSCQVEIWAYWEGRFATQFPEILKNQLSLKTQAFRAAVEEYGRAWTDAQALESALRATRKSGQYPSQEIAR